MPIINPAAWSDRIREVLQCYAEPLVRLVAGRLYRPRGQWPVEELIERCAGSLGNDAVIDRRLHELDPAAQKLLALVAHSRQPRWKAGSLVEMLAAIGHAEGLRPVLTLMDEGLLYPDIGREVSPLNGFEQWMCQAGGAGYWVFTHPSVLARAGNADLELPECPTVVHDVTGVQEADGMDWLLRLSTIWQQASAGPIRQTQSGDFFKRDMERLRGDTLLNASLESPVSVPDPALLAAALARCERLLIASENELRAGDLPPEWDDGILPALESIWTSVLHVDNWNCADGTRDLRATTNPYPAAYLLSLLVLSRLPSSGWTHPGDVEEWVLGHHPYWNARAPRRGQSATPSVLGTFLLGLAYQLRLVQAAKDGEGEWVVRLSDVGRWLLGMGPRPSNSPTHSKTLLVQPNLEIVAYRQGLTPALIAALSRFAVWKAVGPACTLQLQPDSVYRALQSGRALDTILQTLEQHGTRSLPPTVLDTLRTWADKRERLQVYSAAALFEFTSTEDLEAALARGLPGVRLAERILLIPHERMIDYRHFRLIGTRDYSLPPDQCVEIDADGITLTIDPARSDLLLETEMRRFAERVDRPGVNGRRQYRLTPTSLSVGRERGVNIPMLEAWFEQRTGRPLTPAARLLLTGPLMGPCRFKRPLVLQVETAGLADGLMQWPGTHALIHSRLGPTALVIAEENVPRLQERLRELGLSCDLNHEHKA